MMQKLLWRERTPKEQLEKAREEAMNIFQQKKGQIPLSEIAQLTGIPQSTVYHWFEAIQKPDGIRAHYYNLKRYNKALHLRKKKMLSAREISRRVGGVSIRTISNWIRVERKPDDPPVQPRNIKKYYRAVKLREVGCTKTHIARTLGVSLRIIFNWLKIASVKGSSQCEKMKQCSP
jgi:transposase